MITPPRFSSSASPIADDDYDYYNNAKHQFMIIIRLPVSFKQASHDNSKPRESVKLRHSERREIYEQKR